MRLSSYLHRLLIDKLNDCRILVWYDQDRAFGGFLRAFSAPNVRVVSAAESALDARRAAEAVYRSLNEPGQPDANANLLIYLPRARWPEAERTRDPFEVFAAAGAAFGIAEGERLLSLARAAMPDQSEQIEGLFLAGRPAFDLLDQLKASAAYPVVDQVLGTQAVVEVCALVLGSEAALAKLEAEPGGRIELLRLLESELGFVLPAKSKSQAALRERLSEYVLLSELAFDLPGPRPDALAAVPRADLPRRDRLYALCDRLRNSDDTREAYLALANRIENDLKLRDHFQGVTQLGVRDTFAFEEQQYLAALIKTPAVSKTAEVSTAAAAARAILEERRKSVWRHQPERAQIWQVAERCLDLLETACQVDQIPTGSLRLASLVEGYIRADGWNNLDRQQRLMEQAWADCAEGDEIRPLLDLARRRYRESSLRLQTRFLKYLQTQGWPPEGLLRQTQVFDRFVAPALERRVKVAYVLADALRFEMGRALADELAGLGEMALHAAAAALPATTASGMAALLPSADGVLQLRVQGETLVPYLNDCPLPDLPARLALLTEKYGDRLAECTLNQWLDAGEKKRAALAAHDLLILRVGDIDEQGESLSPRQARKHMSGLLGDLKSAAIQLARQGFGQIVIAADHGHVLLPEVLAGDVAPTPEGEWLLSKRRLRVGALRLARPGSLVFKPAHLGLQVDAPDFVVPDGFNVYASDAVYFHEGLSLPECVIPVIELRPKGRPAGSGKQQSVELRYPRDKFTSQVIGLKVVYGALLGEPLRIRLEAYDAANPKGAPIGASADCAARDENTHEITLLPNAETDVPGLIEQDFKGQAIELRAIDPDSGVVWARLKLKNSMLD